MQGFEQAVVEIVDGVWQSVSGAKVGEENRLYLTPLGGPTVAGMVRISGPWDGYVALQCTEAVARRAAGANRQSDPAAVPRSDVESALGELTTLIGADFKALLPEGCHLLPPSVSETVGYDLRVPNAAQVLQCAFRSEEEIFAVTILQTRPASVTA